jgi:hypothetical protein
MNKATNTSAKVYCGGTHIGGKYRKGWLSCTVVDRYRHANLGECVDVVLRDGTRIDCCDPRYVR